MFLTFIAVLYAPRVPAVGILTNPILVALSLLNLINPFVFVPFTQKLILIRPCN